MNAEREQNDSIAAFYKRLEQDRMRERGKLMSYLGAFLGWVWDVAFWGGVVYVVLHFIVKYW